MPDFAPDLKPAATIRVLIADDQPMVRQGLGMLLELLPGVEVAGQASDGEQALELCRTLRPDLLLMDVRMPGMSGPEATRQLRLHSGPPVILMTTFEEAGDMVAGVNAGAAGFLFKNVDIHELHGAMQQVLAGQRVIHPRVAQVLAEAAARSAAPAPAVATLQAPLTEREQVILQALHSGRSNKQIALQLGITENTVKSHLGNLFYKLGAANRTEAVYRAQQLGLLPH